jgi:hypothetical protein
MSPSAEQESAARDFGSYTFRTDLALSGPSMGHLSVSRGVPYAVPARTSMPKIIAAFSRLKSTSSAVRPIHLIAILVAALHAFLAVTAVHTKSPTFDEPQHLTAGYSYWITNDFRLDPENGNLPAMWAALPLLFGDTRFIPLNDRGWQRAEEGRTAHQFLYEAGNDPERTIAKARIMMSIFGAAICLLVYRIAREFFGVIGGLVAEVVAAFDPNFLAHSPLVDSDVPAAFFFTATVWTCWRLFQRITPVRLSLAALSLSGLFLTKFSAPIVLPVLGAMSILQIFSRGELTIQFARLRIALAEKWKKAAAVTASWFFLGAILFTAIWASCAFRYSAWTDNRATHEGTSWHWNYLLEYRGPFENTVGFARMYHLLPEAYLYGLAYVRKHEIDRPAFLDNQWSIIGFRSFFPRAFIYKTPIPFLLLLVLTIYGAIANHRSWRIENIFNPLWGFALLYGAFAVTAQLNIGHRHILPIYVPLFVAVGGVVRLFQMRYHPIFVSTIAILLFLQIGETFAIRPNYLAYFNQIAGGPSHGYQHLVDSSLDWGQDLPALKDWLDDHSGTERKPVYLGYFGTADPRFYQIEAEMVLPENPLSRAPSKLAGGIYCISATTLQSVYALEIGPWCAPYERQYRIAFAETRRHQNRSESTTNVSQIANSNAVPPSKRSREFERLRFARLCAYLRHHEPVARVGYSIFVFDLSDDEVKAALFGPPMELRPTVSVIGY